MVHRHPLLYKILSLIFFGITLVFIILATAPRWSSTARVTFFVLGLFSLVLALIYLSLGIQEKRGNF